MNFDVFDKSEIEINIVLEALITYIHFTQSAKDFIGTYVIVIGYKFL